MEMYTNGNRLMVSVENIDELHVLLAQAKEEAEQLKRTIDRLSCFDIELEFSVRHKVQAGGMESASSTISDIPTK
ncbi:MAG: hypothetical protein LUC30_01110 [Clostridiales bacterium]|nr:hypothetical protein [Clostridiales bacterium]